ncbi:MAG: caspase family protein, partial [Planctomycetota bacterium]|nr:caspase family protein [Planctomycetota bacterium]
DDFERGWKLTGSIFIPSGLKAENWQKIHEVVMPFSVQEVKSEILTTMHGEVRDYSGGQNFAADMAKRMAVVIGVNRHDGFLIHNLRYADQDAQAFYDFLTDDFRGQVPAKNIRLLQNHTATKVNVRKAFEFINKYSRADDTVYVYFAGYGSLVKDEMAGGDGFKKYLVLYDTDVDKLSETALSIEELDSLCDGVNARNVVIILDTSFNVVDGETRTYVDVRQPAEEVTLDDEFLKTLAEGDGRLVLSACTTDQGALMLDEEQHGLFTHYFIEATNLMKTLAGDDGVLTLQEVLTHAIDASIDRADIEGQEQEPKVYGEGAEGIVVAWPTTGEAPPEEDEPAPEEDEAESEEEPPADE